MFSPFNVDIKRLRHSVEDQDEFEDAASELPSDVLRRPPPDAPLDSKSQVWSSILLQQQQFAPPSSASVSRPPPRAGVCVGLGSGSGSDARRSVAPMSRPDASVLTSTPTSCAAAPAAGTGTSSRVPSPHSSTRLAHSQGITVFHTEFYSASPALPAAKREPDGAHTLHATRS